MRIACYLFVLILTLPRVAIYAASAQQTKSDESFNLKLNVRQVLLDVVVLDQSGAPVKGLSKGDFTVQEDGKPQRIQTLEWFDGSSLRSPAASLPKLPPNTFVNVPPIPERGPLYVLYYDMVNTTEDDQMAFRRELLRFIDEAPPGIRMAVFVNAKGLHLVQGFTTDRNELRSALDPKNGRGLVPAVFLYRENFGRHDAGAPLSNLSFIARFLQGYPGRKNLLWAASHFPIPVAPSLQKDGLAQKAGSEPQLRSLGAQGGPQVLDLSGLMSDAVHDTYAALMRAQVALYPVDVKGVIGGGDALAEYDQMNRIAEATGGHAYYSNNRVHLLLEKALEHGETYYTLSYAPTNQSYSGELRAIRLELHRKGNFVLSYRTVYSALPDEGRASRSGNVPSASTATQQDARSTDLRHGMPILHDLLFGVHVSAPGALLPASDAQIQEMEKVIGHSLGEERGHVKIQSYSLDYDLLDPRLRKAVLRNRRQVALDFAAAAYDEDGVLLNAVTNRGFVGPSSQSGCGGTFHAVQELEAPEDTRFIRLVVRDATTGRAGTLEVRVPLNESRDTRASVNAHR